MEKSRTVRKFKKRICRRLSNYNIYFNNKILYFLQLGRGFKISGLYKFSPDTFQKNYTDEKN